jgi:hypothetical protein
MNWKVPFIGGDATNNPDLVKIAGKEAAEGFYFLSPPQPQDLDTPDAGVSGRLSEEIQRVASLDLGGAGR